MVDEQTPGTVRGARDHNDNPGTRFSGTGSVLHVVLARGAGARSDKRG